VGSLRGVRQKANADVDQMAESTVSILCNSLHDGSYASGRFCSSGCAKSFATRDRREEINLRVSKALTGRPVAHDKGFHAGFDIHRKAWTPSERVALGELLRQKRKASYVLSVWEDLPLAERYRRVFSEQYGKCLCGLSEWHEKRLVLEIHHIDGAHQNNSRENLQYLCPNCHSQTPFFRRRKGTVVV
jgi:hypothetical protein